MWVLLAVVSAIFLGTYDIFKKISLNKSQKKRGCLLES